MNSRTRRDLITFINQVENLTQAVLREIGMQAAQEIVQASEDLKESLEADETITEVR